MPKQITNKEREITIFLLQETINGQTITNKNMLNLVKRVREKFKLKNNTGVWKALLGMTTMGMVSLNELPDTESMKKLEKILQKHGFVSEEKIKQALTDDDPNLKEIDDDDNDKSEKEIDEVITDDGMGLRTTNLDDALLSGDMPDL